MENKLDELFDVAKAFDTTGLGRLNLVAVELMEAGLRQIKLENAGSNTNSLEVYSTNEVAKLLKISVRTLSDYRKEFAIEPDYGAGKDARYELATVELIKKKIKERKK